MKNFLKTYFYFSRSERIGIYFLLLLCIIIVVIPKYLPFLYAPKVYNFDAFEHESELFYYPQRNSQKPEAKAEHTEIEMFEFDPNLCDIPTLLGLGLSEKVVKTIMNYRKKGGRFEKKSDLSKIYGLKTSDYKRLAPFIRFETKNALKKTALPKAKHKSVNERTIQPFNFDPNTISQEELMDLGLKEYVAKTVINYRTKGGVFKKKSDILKIYGLDTITYRQLEPYIEIDSVYSTDLKHSKQYETTSKKQIIVDINTSNKEELQALYGIGPYYSNKIIAYRESLGGFHSIEQLKEVYSLPDSTILNIKDNIKISSIIPSLKINHLKAAELCQHPYINVKQAKVIANYRRNHGPYSDLEDLSKVVVLKSQDISKLEPYLNFE